MTARLPSIPLTRRVATKFLLPSFFLLAAFLLHGCGNNGKKAPEPVVNKAAHLSSKLKVSVAEESGVNRVEVYSTWTITNMWCAPIRYPSGSFITRQIEVKETVKRENNYEYVATINDDRFIQDNCKWRIGGYDVRFFRNQVLLATGGIGLAGFKNSNTLKLTCVSDDAPPICWQRSHEAFMRSHFNGVFNADLELER